MFRAGALIILAVALTAATPIPKQSPLGKEKPSEANPTQKHQVADTKTNNAAQFAPTINQAPTQQLKQSADTNRESNEQKFKIDRRVAEGTERLADETNNLADYTAALAFFTFLLALVAIAQFLMFYKQWGVMKEGLGDTKKSADAALATAKTSSDSLTKLERAFVFVPDFGWWWHENLVARTFWYEMRPVLRNSGRSASKNLIFTVNYDFFDDGLPEDFGFPDGKSVASFIGPGAIFTGAKLLFRHGTACHQTTMGSLFYLGLD